MNASESSEGFLGFLSGGQLKFCLLREHRVLADVLLKNFVAAAVFLVSYFLNVVEEFHSCLSKPEGISSYVFCMMLAKFIDLRTHLLIFDYS